MFVSHVFLVQNSKGYEILALDRGQLLPFKDAV